MKPVYLTYQVVQECNSRCVMCNMWKKEPKKELRLEDISKIFLNKFFSNLKWVILTGGEPFLRNDLVKIIEVLNKLPSLKWITINTNGFLTEKIIRDVKESLRVLKSDIHLGVTISIHSTGKTHDNIMGVPLAYNKATKTLKNLKRIQDRRFHLQILAVISKYNLKMLEDLRKESKKLGVVVDYLYPTISKYFNNEKNKKIIFNKREKKSIIKFLDEIKVFDLMRFYYIKSLSLSLKRDKRSFARLDGYQTMSMDCEGNVFTCFPLAYDGSPYKFGNSLKEDFNNVWFSRKANLIRKRLKSSKKCKNCFHTCGMINDIESEFFQFAFFLLCHPLLIKGILNKKIKDGLKFKEQR